MELSPEEERLIKEQLNLDPTAQVKIKVSGGENLRKSLVGTGLATCKLVSAEGDVIKEKLLQGQKIFGLAKKHVTLPHKFVDIVTISDDDEEDSLTPNKQQQIQNDKEGGIMMETPGQGGSKTGVKKHLSKEQRNQIVKECVEDQISPADLARKW